MPLVNFATPAPTNHPVQQAAQRIGRTLGLELARRLGVDPHAITSAGGYATTASERLGNEARRLLKRGDAAAAAIDSMILDVAIATIVTTFRCCAGAARNVRATLARLGTNAPKRTMLARFHE